jgi:integrase
MAGNRITFNKGVLQSIEPLQGKRQTFYDTKTPKLALQVTSAGAKSFYVVKRAGAANKPTWFRLGSFPEMTVEQARAKANQAIGEIATGKNPAQIRREERATAQQGNAPAMEAWERYIAIRSAEWSDSHRLDHEKVSTEGGVKRTRGKRQGESELTQQGILRPLLLHPLGNITADRVAAWLDKERVKRPTHTRLAFGLLRAFLNWAASTPDYREAVQTDACTDSEVRRKVPSKGHKTDVLQREMLKLWFSGVKAIPNQTISTYLQCLLLTGARREEMAALKWADVDFDWLTITMRDKVEGTRTIPMTPYLRQILLDQRNRTHAEPNVKALERLAEKGKKWKVSPYVFPSPTAKGGKIAEPRIAHTKALTAVGLPHVSLHGLRRSFGTLSEWVECPVGIAAQIQGHKPSALAEKHYRQRPLDLLRVWATKIEAWLLTEADIAQPKEKAAKPLSVINGGGNA